MKIYFESYGCSSNFADEEIMKGLLKEAGFRIVNNFREADLIVLNTCNVKLPTSQRMIHRIKFFTQTSKPLVVAGCMSKTERGRIEKINPKASLIGPNSIFRIVDVVRKTLKGKKVVFLEDIKKPKLCMPRIRRNKVIGIIPIATGCLSACSYCIVRFARGRLFSYPLELIIKEIKTSLKEGCKEIWLTSQDNGCYGFDLGLNLAKLLEEISKIEGKFFVRVGMMNPLFVRKFLEELVKNFADEKIFKFVHIPVQSGSDKVLKDMKRNYSIKDFLKIVKTFRKNFPKITLSTDIIVGYPTETDEDFEKTLDLIREIKPDIVNISKFQPRPLTEASKLKPLAPKTVKERSRKIFKLVKQIALTNNEKWIGWKGEVLVDEKGKENTWISRNFAYKPIVIKSEENLLGKFIDVEIRDAKSNYLIGEII